MHKTVRGDVYEMESKSVGDIALRLLKLEQKFDSYCALYEDELREMRVALGQLREDLLSLQRDVETGRCANDRTSALGDDISDDDASESAQVLAL